MPPLLVPSPSPYAPLIGFSAAVRAGDRVLVAGTTAVDAQGEVVGGDDAAAQAREALRKIEAALQAGLEAQEIGFVALAGFMRVLGSDFVQHYEGRMLNIHPSLLPAFTGLHTHRRALEAGCKAVGATVHFVTAQLDHGPIVMQGVVPVLPGDDEGTLSSRVLAMEHAIYPLAVRWFVQDKLRLRDGVVSHVDGASQVLM